MGVQHCRMKAKQSITIMNEYRSRSDIGFANYMKRLRSLCGDAAVVTNLLTPIETQNLAKIAKQRLVDKPVRLSCQSTDLAKDIMESFIDKLFDSYKGKISVWIEDSLTFGALQAENIKSITLNFIGMKDKNSVIVILCQNGENEILFDLDNPNSGKCIIEINGTAWRHLRPTNAKEM